MTPLASPLRRERTRLTIDGRGIAFDLSRESVSGWSVDHDGRRLGLVYRLASPGGLWRMRPRGRPAPAVGYSTRGGALAALYEATKR